MKKIDLKFVKDWAKRNLVNTQVYCPVLKAYVNFTMGGIKHGVHFKTTKIKLQILFNIMSIIKKAKKVRVEKEKDPSKNKDVKKVFLLKTEYLIEQTIYDVYVVIKEKKSGHFYYDSGEIKKSTKQDG